MNNKRKHKRTKVQCLTCGSSFDYDYRRKHEIYMHGGSHVKVKDVGFCLGVANNPFTAARLNFERKVRYLVVFTILEYANHIFFFARYLKLTRLIH